MTFSNPHGEIVEAGFKSGVGARGHIPDLYSYFLMMCRKTSTNALGDKGNTHCDTGSNTYWLGEFGLLF
jgi:hypothetical protein